jgi:hypothetical protein
MLLRDAACHPEATKISCDERAGVHARAGDHLAAYETTDYSPTINLAPGVC